MYSFFLIYYVVEPFIVGNHYVFGK